MRAKRPSESAIETRYILAPHQVNAYGTAFGGAIMSWVDVVAAMVGQRHSQGLVVTASIDKISFKSPIYVGDHVILKASVNYVGNTSMEIGVLVLKEDPRTGEQTRATTAYLTFVHLDKNGKPKKVTALDPTTPDEKRRYQNAKHRVEARKELLRKLNKAD